MSTVSSAANLLNAPTPTRFFGMNVGAFWRDLLTAWQGMLEWPVLSWLWPQLAVRLYLPTGEQAVCRGPSSAPDLAAPGVAGSARLQAVVLPESLLLRKTLSLPRLQTAELLSALRLEIQDLTPFAPDDLVWTHDVAPGEDGLLQVQLALSSRRLINQHLQAALPQLAPQVAEVWLPRTEGAGFLVLPGFGDARRQRQNLGWRWASALLALLALMIAAAMALTPTVKLYFKVVQANLAMASLQQKAAPAIAQRESLVRVSEQLSSLAALAGKPVPPLQALKRITEALPDDTSLLGLQIQGLKVNISGQTGNAAALMKQLGATPGLHDVKAPAPATKPLGAPKETFTIEFMLDPVPAAVLAAAPATPAAATASTPTATNAGSTPASVSSTPASVPASAPAPVPAKPSSAPAAAVSSASALAKPASAPAKPAS